MGEQRRADGGALFIAGFGVGAALPIFYARMTRDKRGGGYASASGGAWGTRPRATAPPGPGAVGCPAPAGFPVVRPPD